MTKTKEIYDPVTYRSGTRQGVRGDTFSSNMPHRAPVLCYIAGIECPIVSVDVSYGVGKIPEAQVTMFPDPQLQRFGHDDRVPIVLFYLDEYIAPSTPSWRMLFEGEITGWGYTNSSAGRAIQFDCVMDIAVWTQLYLFYMSSVSGIVQGALNNAPEKIPRAVALYPYALFHQGLMPKNDASFITRPYDFAYNIIRGLISNKVPRPMQCVPAVNFFSRWIRRQNFHNKWVALPFLDEVSDDAGVALTDQPEGVFPILRAVKSAQAIKTIQDQVSQGQHGDTIYNMLNSVLDTVFMELCMLPTPCAVSTYTNGSIIGAPNLRTPEEVEALWDARRKAAAHPLGPVADLPVPQQEQLGPLNIQQGPTLTEVAVESVPDPGVIDPKKPMRLTNYFIKPEFRFGLPPVFNVIFPSMTPHIQYRENYATQPTRLYIQDAGLTNLLTSSSRTQDTKQIITNALARAYPPEADQKFQSNVNKRLIETGKNLLIYPVEFFKGPVTLRRPAPPWTMYYATHIQGSGAPSGANPETPSDKSTVPPGGDPTAGLTDKDVYRLYAQYEFFREKYARRQGAVECAFQPYLVPGFPLMVFDDFQDKLHVMGYLMNTHHHISAQNVKTSLNFTHGRTLYEFFEDVAAEMDNPVAEDKKGLAVAAAPAEPIKEVRDIIQHFWKADQFYQALFYQRTPAEASKKRPAVFQYRDILAFVKSDGTLEDIYIEGKNEERVSQDKKTLLAAKKLLSSLKQDTKTVTALYKGTAYDHNIDVGKYINAIDLASGGKDALDRSGVSYPQVFKSAFEHSDVFEVLLNNLDLQIKALEPENRKVSHNITSKQEFTPKPGFEPYFDSYDAAMSYCSRPICTLEDYITMMGGVREGPNDQFVYKKGTVSARYYAKIRNYTGATEETRKTIAEGAQGVKQVNGKWVDAAAEALPDTFPDLSQDWTVSLLRYRNNVYSAVKGQR